MIPIQPRKSEKEKNIRVTKTKIPMKGYPALFIEKDFLSKKSDSLKKSPSLSKKSFFCVILDFTIK